MRRGFFRHILKHLALPAGQIMRPATGGAAAVWMPSENLGPNPLIQELRALPVLIGMTGWSRFSRLIGLREVMDKHHPMETPHDYLFFLGVTPAAQGHGVGSRLIRSRLERLDAIGRPAFLETATEPNVRLYRRHGFRVLSEWRPAPDGPVNWSMWRDPQPLA
jgi:ribosomal protein S18 acetylase RimI-like enzyme